MKVTCLVEDGTEVTFGGAKWHYHDEAKPRQALCGFKNPRLALPLGSLPANVECKACLKAAVPLRKKKREELTAQREELLNRVAGLTAKIKDWQ